MERAREYSPPQHWLATSRTRFFYCTREGFLDTAPECDLILDFADTNRSWPRAIAAPHHQDVRCALGVWPSPLSLHL